MAIPGSPATKQRIRARPCAAARFHWRAFPGSVYRPRRPTQTPLYQVVQHHVETFWARSSESDPTGYGLPESALPHAMHALRGGPGVERDFRGYLECGILAHGFARARCEDCGHERLIPFSCKGRGICPSCNARHMREVAAHLTDHVLPHVPTRHVGALRTEAPASLPPPRRAGRRLRAPDLLTRDSHHAPAHDPWSAD
jgi:hypothetical protein